MGAGSVLIIGGAGYVGSSLVRQLLNAGHRVRVLDLLVYGDRAMAELRQQPQFEFVHGDFRDAAVVSRCMQGVGAVVHLGAIVGDPAGDLDPAVTHDVNAVAVRQIAETARAQGISRFVFTSTCSVYGSSEQLLDEGAALQALSTYAKSKVAAEQALQSMLNGFAPTILRLGTMYGLAYRPRFDLVVNLLVAKAVLEGQIVIMNGQAWRPFVHVEDAAQAIRRCVEAAQTPGGTFNVCTENCRLADVAELIREMLPSTKVTHVHEDGPHPSYRVSWERIRQVGLRPTRTLRDGIEEVEAAIRGGSIRDYRASQYSNFKFLTEFGFRAHADAANRDAGTS